MNYREFKVRMKRERSRSRVFRGFAMPRGVKIALLAVGLYGALWMSWRTAALWRTQDALFERGTLTEGRVLERGTFWSSGNRVRPPQMHYYVRFEFDGPDGQRYEGGHWMGETASRKMLPGAAVRVVYLAEDPRSNRLADLPRGDLLWAVMLSLALTAGFGTWLAAVIRGKDRSVSAA